MENTNNTTMGQEQTAGVKQPSAPDIIDIGKVAWPKRLGRWAKRHIKDAMEVFGGIALGVIAKTIISEHKKCDSVVETEEIVDVEPIDINTDEL